MPLDDETRQQIERETFGKAGAELARLVLELMRSLEGEDWPEDVDDFEFGLVENGQIFVAVGDANYVFGHETGTITEMTRSRIRRIGRAGVLEEYALVPPELN